MFGSWPVPVMCNLQTFVECEYFQSGDGPAWHPLKMSLVPSFHPFLLVKTGCFTFSSGSCCHYVFHYRCDPEMYTQVGDSLLWRSKVPDSSYIVY